MTTTNTQSAKVGITIAAIREWQRGAITAAECERRMRVYLSDAEIKRFWPVVTRTTLGTAIEATVRTALGM